jgi:hypothetical protein
MRHRTFVDHGRERNKFSILDLISILVVATDKDIVHALEDSSTLGQFGGREHERCVAHVLIKVKLSKLGREDHFL